MANNGFLNGAGDCVGEVEYLALTYCPSAQASFRFARIQLGPTLPRAYSCVSSTNTSLSVSVPPYACEIAGPPYTESEQIEAINGLFPSAIAILAIAWGFKYIRVLVAEWLKERNASD